MCTIYPSINVRFTNKIEKKVYHYLKENLSDKCICYYNYNIKIKETDFIVIIPGEGICIIEVKGWDGSQITNIVDNNTIKYKQNGTEYESSSPLKQCKRYTHELEKLIQQKLGIKLFVAPIVCYPEMDESTFNEKRLDIVSDPTITLLKEDFNDSSKFMRILLNKMNQDGTHHPILDQITAEAIVDIRKMFFETYENIEESLTYYEKKMIQGTEREAYSILAFIPKHMGENKVKELVRDYLCKWVQGTKIILLSENNSIQQVVYCVWKDELSKDFTQLEGREVFEFWDHKKNKVKNRVFNFQCYSKELEGEIKYFEIIDGHLNEETEHLKILEQYNDESDFNIDQYRIEHENYKKNIVVKAGAGTGKTYSMVSRIGFLVYKNKFKPEDLVASIIMITFTNEAADNMKKRLKEYFSNMLILTQNVYYLAMMENTSKMNISTIHSLVKRIIEKYSVHIGIGNAVSIESGVYKKREHITNDIENYIKLHKQELDTSIAQYEKYEVVKAIENFLHKLESKNINFDAHYDLGFAYGGKEQKSMFKMILNIAEQVQREVIQEDFEGNTVQLGNLILYLDKVVVELEKLSDLEKTVKYLFVDEFQDTDNVQIDLIKKFQRLFEFNLFVVGDIKQSIYRFRGAQHHAFERLLETEDMNWWSDHSLKKNYRSIDELLDAFNEKFVGWAKEGLLTYKHQDKLEGVNKIQGLAKFEGIAHKSKEEFEKEFIETLQGLRDKLDKNESIGILTRTNKQIKQIRKLCEARGIRVETDVADNLYTLESTMDLYKLVLALLFPKNPKYLYNLSLTNYGTDISSRIVYKYKDTPREIVKLFEKGEMGGVPNWNRYIERLKQEPIIRVIKDIIMEQKPWHQYANHFDKLEEQFEEKKRYKRNLDCLIEEIIEKSNQDYITLNKLRDFLYIMIFAKGHQDQREINDELEQSKCKVICTTVHRSKGLEYTHVILPYCHLELEEIKGNELIMEKGKIGMQFKLGNKLIMNNIFKEQKQEELVAKVSEEIRILYVAMTRAEKTFTWFNDREESESNSKIKKSWQQYLRGEQ